LFTILKLLVVLITTLDGELVLPLMVTWLVEELLMPSGRELMLS
jgi:hypothetical protein